MRRLTEDLGDFKKGTIVEVVASTRRMNRDLVCFFNNDGYGWAMGHDAFCTQHPGYTHGWWFHKGRVESHTVPLILVDNI